MDYEKTDPRWARANGYQLFLRANGLAEVRKRDCTIYHVALDDPENACTCKDFEMREGGSYPHGCKHMYWTAAVSKGYDWFHYAVLGLNDRWHTLAELDTFQEARALLKRLTGFVRIVQVCDSREEVVETWWNGRIYEPDSQPGLSEGSQKGKSTKDLSDLLKLLGGDRFPTEQDVNKTLFTLERRAVMNEGELFVWECELQLPHYPAYAKRLYPDRWVQLPGKVGMTFRGRSEQQCIRDACTFLEQVAAHEEAAKMNYAHAAS